MKDKEDYCKQLIKKLKDLIPKTPKAELGSSSLELRSNWEEREIIIRKLKKECWKFESLSRHDRCIIGEELYERYKKLKAMTKIEASSVGSLGEIRVSPKHIKSEDIRERIEIEKELVECLEFLSDKSLREISRNDMLDFKTTQKAIEILVDRKRLRNTYID